MLERFFWFGGDPTLLMVGTYQPALVVLSLVLAVLVSCIAMQVAGLARAGHSTAFRQMAIATGTVSLGVGIWSMHFIGMMAFELCTPVRYTPFITVVSMVPALLASWIALSMLVRESVTRGQLLAGGLLVGGGIGAMHYMGMGAMQMAPLLRFDPLWFFASLVVSVLLAWFALWLRFGLHKSCWLNEIHLVLLSGAVMGGAVASMHYVAMRAARFVGEDVPGYTQTIDFDLVISITVVTLTLGMVVLAGNLVLRFRALYNQLRISELRQKAIFDTAVDGIITIERDGIVVSVNPSVERMFGWQPHELIGNNISMLMPEPQRSMHDGYLANYLGGAPARVIGIGRETTAQRKDGSTFPIRLAVGQMRFGKRVMFVGFITDISEQKRIEQLLEREAFHDPLTDLPNRRQLSVMLPRGMARADRSGDLLALMFLDLDGFKQVNDELGHDIGDELLKEVARRLLGAARRTDFVVRLGGDEFVVVLEGLHDEDEAGPVADKFSECLAVPMVLGGHELVLRASIGTAFYHPADGITAEQLLHHADLAMYAVKKKRRSGAPPAV